MILLNYITKQMPKKAYICCGKHLFSSVTDTSPVQKSSVWVWFCTRNIIALHFVCVMFLISCVNTLYTVTSENWDLKVRPPKCHFQNKYICNYTAIKCRDVDWNNRCLIWIPILIYSGDKQICSKTSRRKINTIKYIYS